MQTVDGILRRIAEQEIEFVDFRYVDPYGALRHVTLPARAVTPDVLRDGIEPSLDTESGLRLGTGRLLPDLDTAYVDQLAQHATLVLLCDFAAPAHIADGSFGARGLLKRAQLAADHVFAPAKVRIRSTVQFCIFDHASFSCGAGRSHVNLESRDAPWRRGREEPDNLGTQPHSDEATWIAPPADHLFNLRSELATELLAAGVPVERHARGPGLAGQQEFTIAALPALRAVDAVIILKDLAKNVAARHGKVATFMPQPLGDGPGNGWAISLVIGYPDRAPDKQLTQLAERTAAGLAEHYPAICPLLNPSINSFHRLNRFRPAYWAENNQRVSKRPPVAPFWINLSIHEAAMTVSTPWPDLSGDPHVSAAALVTTAAYSNAITGPASERQAGPALFQFELPSSLEHAIDAMPNSLPMIEFMNVFEKGGALTAFARRAIRDLQHLRGKPHPAEFELYFNV